MFSCFSLLLSLLCLVVSLSSSLSYVRLFLSPPLSLRFLLFPLPFVLFVPPFALALEGGIYRATGSGAVPIAAIWPHMGSGQAALSQRRVGWAVGVVGRRDSLGSSSSKGVGLRVFGRARGEREREAKKLNFSFFPCCTFRGRRKRNSVVQNDTVLVFFFKKKT